MLKRLFGKFSKDLGIDLGTANTLVYVKDQGIVINEPSVVAINNRTDQILAVGQDAKIMIGKTPAYITITRPMVDGVISDFEVTEKMLRYFIDKVHKESFTLIPRPRVVVAIPLDITEVEHKAVEDAVTSAGAREVLLIEQPVAAAIGAGLQIQEATANMVVEIGGGTTEIAVISLGGVVTWKSLKLAGDKFNEAIAQHIRDKYNLILGDKTAERVKIDVGSAMPLKEKMSVTVRGRDAVSGLPREIDVSDTDIREALVKPLRIITDNIKLTIENTPPELVADLYQRGLVLSGGGALLRSLDRLIEHETKIPVHITNDPLTSVVRGTGVVLEEFDTLKQILLPSTRDGAWK